MKQPEPRLHHLAALLVAAPLTLAGCVSGDHPAGPGWYTEAAGLADDIRGVLADSGLASEA